jgi:D-inositol-3-phosphate glycosyltransferase
MRNSGTIDRNCCLRLIIIGGDPNPDDGEISNEMARLQALCDEYELFDLIVFLGKKGQDDLPYYYSAAETLVMPSHYESFGMVALESMACGTPVVASEVGGLAFLVEDGVTGFHFLSEDAEMLSEKLTLLIEDEALRTRMSQRAAEVAKEYGWQKIAGKIFDVYNDLLAESNGGRKPQPSFRRAEAGSL